MIALLFLALISGSYGARILAVIPMPAKSHNIVFQSLLVELAARQHQLTVVSYFPQEKPRANYTDIVLYKDKLGFGRDKGNMFEMSKMGSFTKTIFLWVIGNMIAEKTLEEEVIQQLIHDKNQKFDLVLTEAFFNEALFGFAHKFKAPLITLCPFGGTHWMGHAVGSPSPFAYVPDTFLDYTDHMTFLQRLHNTLAGVFMLLGRALYYMPKQNAIMKKYFNFTEPSLNLWEIQSQTSLFLANSHVSLGYPRPLVPNFIEIGGMHIKPPQKLPQDLQQYLDNAPNGVVYFSMGSALQSKELPENKRKALIEAFSKLKQKVLWKWEDDTLPDQPSNLKISKWFPQADILAHPNIRVFITHGGLLSSMEAIYHGVPLIGIPIFGDQKMNMARAQLAGYGLTLDYETLTTDSLQHALNEVIHKPSYRENARRLSRIFKDQPQTPMERAVYWVEYVLRHKGAPHLRSAALDLHWHQYFLLDVIAVITLAAATVAFLIYFFLRKTLRLLCNVFKKRTPDSKETKKRK